MRGLRHERARRRPPRRAGADRSCSRRERVIPHIGATFTLDEVAAALRYVADGRAIGKVVLDVASDHGDAA